MAVYAAAIALGSFLLFAVQPLAGRELLPAFGGTAMVWGVSLVFFQLGLLVGYGLAASLIGRGGRARLLFLGLVAAACGLLGWRGLGGGSPLAIAAGEAPGDDALGVLSALAGPLLLPTLALAAGSPLLQAWFAARFPGRSPYPLFALSNAGSLAALLLYPFLIEPALGLRAQGWIWAGLLLVYLALVGRCALGVPPTAAVARGERTAGWLDALVWAALAAAASALLVGASNHLGEAFGALPLLWVLPLALYLLTMILAFGGAYRRDVWGALALPLLLLGGLALGNPLAPLWLRLLAPLGLLTVGAALLHGELERAKPPPAELGGFYLTLAAGGAAGGCLVALGAPVWLPAVWEFELALGFAALALLVALARDPRSPWRAGHALAAPAAALGLGLACALAPARPHADPSWVSVIWRLRAGWPLAVALLAAAAVLSWGGEARRGRLSAALAWLALVGLLPVALALHEGIERQQARALTLRRGFFSALAVHDEPGQPPQRTLRHGRVVHGSQVIAGGQLLTRPTLYYTDEGGVAMALRAHPRRRRGAALSVGVIGLGAGALASRLRAGDRAVFYELDPLVIELAGLRGSHFSFLRRSRARVEVLVGDAFQTLRRATAPERFDLLAVDAFQGGSVPVHLLTLEALDLYLANLRDREGVIAVNATIELVDLRRVLGGLAAARGLRLRTVELQPGARRDRLSVPCRWVLLSRGRGTLDHPLLRAAAAPVEPPPLAPWTLDRCALRDALVWPGAR